MRVPLSNPVKRSPWTRPLVGLAAAGCLVLCGPRQTALSQEGNNVPVTCADIVGPEKVTWKEPVTVVLDICQDPVPSGTQGMLTVRLLNGEIVAQGPSPLTFITPSKLAARRNGGSVDHHMIVDGTVTSPWNPTPLNVRMGGIEIADHFCTDGSETNETNIDSGGGGGDDVPPFEVDSSTCTACGKVGNGGAADASVKWPVIDGSLGDANTDSDPPGGRVTFRPGVDRIGIRLIEMLATGGVARLVHPQDGRIQIASADGVTVVTTNVNGQSGLSKFYTFAKAGTPDGNGFYNPTEDPDHWMSLERVTNQQDAPYGFLAKRSTGSSVEYTRYTPGGEAWSVTRGDGTTTRQSIANTSEWIDTTLTEGRVVRDPANGNNILRDLERRRVYLADKLTLVSDDRIVKHTGGQFSDRWEYYTDESETYRFGRVKRIVTGVRTVSSGAVTGSWVEWDYDSDRRISVERRGVLDAQPGATCRTYTHDYTPVDSLDDGTEFPNTPRRTVETVGNVEVARTYRAYYLESPPASPNPILVEISERCVAQGAAYGAGGNLRTTRRTWKGNYSNQPGDDNPATVQHPDGRLETYTYEFGQYDTGTRAFTTDSTGRWERVTVTRGLVSAPSGIAFQTLREVSIVRRVDRRVEWSETRVYTGSDYAQIDWTANAYDGVGRLIRTDRSDGTYQEISMGCCGPTARIGYDGVVEDYTYDALGRRVLTSREGAPANSGAPGTAIETAEVYDAARRVIRRRVSAGSLALTNHVAYDSAGRLLRNIDEQGRTNRFEYSSDGRQVLQTNPSGFVTRQAHYFDGRMADETSKGTAVRYYTYGTDANGQQWTHIAYGAADGTMWEKTWTDLLGRTVRRERPAFGGGTLVETLLYDAAGRVTKTTATGKPSTLYAYNDLGERIRTALDLDDDGTMDLSGPDRVTGSLSGYVADGSGHWWRHSTSTVYAAESGDTPTVVSVQRERLSGLGTSGARGLLTGETVSLDIRGNATTSQTWTDRSAKRIARLDTIPGSANTAVQVAVNGLTVTNISATAVTVAVAYDALGRQTEARTASDGGARSVASVTAYDILGRVASVADAANNTTKFAYDGAGRRVATTNALGLVTLTAYDPEDRVIATWGATYPVAYEFDAFGRMVAMATTRDPAQESVNLLTLLPTGGSLSESSVAALDVTRWVYDAATGLMTSKVYADDKGPSYTFTSDGKLSRRTWARGVTADYSYDSSGALTGVNYSDSTPDVTLAYDRIGRQTRIADGTGGLTNVYDGSILDLIEERLPGGSVLARSQDSFGRPIGIALGTAYDVNYGFDTSGRFGALTSTVGSVQSAFAYSYVPDSDLLAGWGVGGGISFRRTYESSRDLIATVTNTWNGTALGTFGYDNDSISRRTKRIDSGSVTNDFGYNPRSEVVSAMMGANQFGYRYDPIGNRIASTNNAEAFSYAANELNQYTSIVDGGTVTPAYDDDGNLTSCGSWTYTWDGENRLVIATDGSVAVTNAYDFASRRASKGTAVASRTFIYDGWNLISEIKTQSSEVSTTFYVWGLDLSRTLQGAGGVGGLLSVVRGDAPYFTGYDANGNVTDYVSANGTAVAHYEFDPFGNTTAATGSMADTFAHRFSTKYWDSETALYYYGHRFYRPGVGRWMNRDPISEWGGAHLYGFVYNKPVTWADSDGRWIMFTPQAHIAGLVWTESSALARCDEEIMEWRSNEYNLAADLFQHYLDGTGEPFTLSDEHINEIKEHGKSAICEKVGAEVCKGTGASRSIKIEPKNKDDSNVRWGLAGNRNMRNAYGGARMSVAGTATVQKRIWSGNFQVTLSDKYEFAKHDGMLDLAKQEGSAIASLAYNAALYLEQEHGYKTFEHTTKFELSCSGCCPD